MPTLNSIRIKGPKNTYYMYPGTFIETLKELNNEISKILNDANYKGFKEPSCDNFFEKREDSFSYIITRINIDLNKNADSIFEELRTFFKPLLIIFSFLFSEIFTIKKAFFFRKYYYGYKFIRMLETPDFHKEISKKSKLKEIIYQDDVEVIFPFILARMCGKERYLEFIDGYLVGKIRSSYVGNKISNYWNCFEHFAQRYCKEKKKTKILNKKTKKNLNKIVKGALNLIKQEDIKFPNLKLQQILSQGLLLPDNSPPILNKIFYMCYKKHIKLSDEEKKLVKMINDIRNKLYHEETYLTHLLGQLAKKFKLADPTLLDIAKFSQKFSLIIEKVILRFFKIIPNYFILAKKDYYHFLKYKEIKLPSLKTKRQRQKEFIEERFNMEGLTGRERRFKHLIYDKKELLREGKYLFLIKYLERFKLEFQQLTYDNYVSGAFKGDKGTMNVNIRLKGDLKGDIEFLSKNKLEIYSITKGEFKFQSNINASNNNFGIEFIPLLKKISYTHYADLEKNTNPTGKFLTLMIDIKELV